MIERTGTIEFDGREIDSATPADAIVRAGIAQVPQGRGTFTDLTRRGQPPRRRVHARRAAVSTDDLAYWYEMFPRLAERRDQKAGACPAASSRCWRSPGR